MLVTSERVPVDRYRFGLPLVWILLASSSVVFIEPAPYDILLMGLIALFLLLGMRIPAGIGLGTILMGIFLLSNLISSMLAPDPASTLRSLFIRFYMVAAWVFFTALIMQAPRQVLGTIWSGYIVAAIIAACAGIVGYFELGGNPEQLVENGRVRAFFKDPNVYGPFLVPVAMYCLARLLDASRAQAFRLIALFLFLCFGILLGFSRGSWANFVISMLSFFVLGAVLFSGQHRLRLFYLAGALVVSVPVLIAQALSTDRIATMIEKRAKLVQYYDAGEGGRFDNQLEVVKRIGVEPFGLGPGQSSRQRYFARDPHNLYLHVLIESGWVGATAFYAFLLLTVQKGYRLVQIPSRLHVLHVAVFATLIGTLAQSFFIDSTHWRHMYLLFAMIWGPYLASRAPVARGARGP